MQMKNAILLFTVLILGFNNWAQAQCPVSATPNFVVQAICLGDTARLVDSSLSVDSGQHQYAWDFTTDSIIDDQTFGSTIWVPTQAGSFTVSLTIRDTSGCASTVTKQLVVGLKPRVSITGSPVCAGQTVVINDLSSQTDSNSQKWFWDYTTDGIIDDSTTKGSINIATTAPNSFTASLRIVDSSGCQDQGFVTILVRALPSIVITADTVCAGDSTQLLSFGSTTPNSQYLWDVDDDGNTDFTTSGSLLYRYPNPGIFNPTVRVIDSNGCSTSAQTNALVRAFPIAAFGFQSTTSCTTTPVVFLDSSVAPLDGIYQWDFNNDGTIDTTARTNIKWLYPIAGTYTASLSISNGGCVSRTQRNLFVNSSLISVNAGSDKTIICSNNTTLTAATNRTTGVSFSWFPTQYLSNPAIASPIATPDTTTTYVIAASFNGCTAFDTITIAVTPLIINAGVDQSVVCGTAVNINTSSNISSGLIYQWSPSIGLNSTTAATVNALPLQTTTYAVIATKGTCRASDSVTVTVNPMQVSAGTDRTITCSASTTLTTSVNTTGVSYAWSPTSGLSSFTVASPNATPTTTTNYIVTATKGGCIAADTVTVEVVPFTVFAGSDRTVICGTTTTLAASSSGVSGGTFSWFPQTGLNNPFIASPTLVATTNQDYIVTVSKGECSYSDTMRITINRDLPLAFIANKQLFTSRPYTVRFTNQTTNSNAYIYNWQFGDGNSSTQISPTYTYSDSGSYDITLIAQTAAGQCLDTLVQRNFIQCFILTSLNDEDAPPFAVFPNPSQGWFDLSFSSPVSNALIAIYDSKGAVVFKAPFTGINYQYQHDLPAGIYNIIVSHPNVSLSKKLVVAP
jgi:PKD repeat protein